MAEEQGTVVDGIVGEFSSYEDYLDSQISPTDLYYLEDEDLARQLVVRAQTRLAPSCMACTQSRGLALARAPISLQELGYRGSGETLKREEFEARKRAAEQARMNKLRAAPKALASASKDLSGFPFLASLAEREEMVRNGKLTTIIFIRDKNHKGQEVSGYIDYAHRLKTENFEPYFERKHKLMPKPSDLSFYNWETQTSTSNATQNFQVIADNEAGLLFKNKRDRKVINVDPKSRPGDNSRRIELQTHEYIQVCRALGRAPHAHTRRHATRHATPCAAPCAARRAARRHAECRIRDPSRRQVVLYDHVTRRKT